MSLDRLGGTSLDAIDINDHETTKLDVLTESLHGSLDMRHASEEHRHGLDDFGTLPQSPIGNPCLLQEDTAAKLHPSHDHCELRDSDFNPQIQEEESADRLAATIMPADSHVTPCSYNKVCGHGKARGLPDGKDEHPRWQPRWLDPVILGTFGFLFAAIATALIFLAIYSGCNGGLADAHDNLAYAWRFGPTAFFTLISVLWARIELQALRYMPLFDIQRAGAPEDAFDLDYTGMMLHVVFLQSLKRKHFLVFTAVFTSVAFKLQIALSSSLFQSVLIRRFQTVEVQILNVFADNAEKTNVTVDSDAYVASLKQFDMDFPFGISPECVYQTFTLLDANGTAIRPTAGKPLTVTVDGLFLETECKVMEAYEVFADATAKPDAALTIALQFEECEEVIQRQFALDRDINNIALGEALDFYYLDEFASENAQRCSSLPQQSRQFVYAVTDFFASPYNESLLDIRIVGAVLCSSFGWISRVQVTDTGSSQTISPSINQADNTSFNVDSWQNLGASGTLLDSFRMLTIEPEYVGNTTSSDGLRRRYQSRDLGFLVPRLTRNYTAMVAHHQLRRDVQDRVHGTQMQTVARLLVNMGICVSMAVVSAIGAICAFYASRFCQKMSGHYCRDPATILGMIVNICGSPKQFDAGIMFRADDLRESRRTGKASWNDGDHSPLILASGLRMFIIISALLLITAFSLSLRRSQNHDGLVSVDGGGYWPLLWQLLPTLFLLFMSLYSTSSDAAIRGLAELSDVLNRPCYSCDLDVSISDMLGIRALERSVRLGKPAVALSHILAGLFGLLPIISSVLLTSENVPSVKNITVEEESWFGTRMITEEQSSKNGRAIESLSLLRDISNFTSPRHTYLDLLFPSFSINDPGWGPGASARVKTSAARLSPTCMELSNDDFQINKFDFGDINVVELVEETECFESTRQNGTLAYFHHNPSDTGTIYFAGSTSIPGSQHNICNNSGFYYDNTTPFWVDQRYVWGTYSTTQLAFDHLAVWKCNYSWVDIVTEVNLLWSAGDIIIDHINPPVWDDSIRQLWIPSFGVPVSSYDGLTGSTSWPATQLEDANFAYEFGKILQPYGNISIQDLGQRGKDEQVLQALHATVAFTAAQLANIEQRLELNETSQTSPTTAPNRHSQGRITGTMTDNLRQRVIQNPAITFTLISILSLFAAVHIWVLLSGVWYRSSRHHGKRPWLLDLELRGVAPPGFGSVNMIRSLLEGSNCSSILPENAHLMSAEQLKVYLAGKRFRLGWFYNTETGVDVYTIGVLNEGNLVFRGSRT